MTSPIHIEAITKSYPAGKHHSPVEALKEITFSVSHGELFGMIGPDGAGKTTLFRILATLILADRGTATVAGCNVLRDYKQLRRKIGYMPGRFSLYQDLTVEENLTFFATVFNTTIRENYSLIKDIYIQLEPFKHRRAGKLSGGMKQKLALCCALIHKPEVLLLDEPTTGVDPVSRREFWDMLDKLKRQGIPILVSTPYMDEANRCDRVALMRSGQLLSVDTPLNICRTFKPHLWAVQANPMYPLLNDLRTYPGTISCYAFGNAHHLAVEENNFDTVRLQSTLETKGYRDIRIQLISPTIEDAFMAL